MKKYIVLTASILLTILALYLTSFIRFSQNYSSIIFIFRIILLIMIAILSIFELKRLLKEKIRGFLLSFYIFLVFFIFLELIFMNVVISSQNSYSLSAQKWLYKYYSLNELGYRDVPMNIRNPEKPAIVVLGDSFVAGHGIKNSRNRVSNLLQLKYEDKYEVFNLGIGGSNTVDEYERLKAFPIKPEIIILYHITDDILPNETWNNFPIPSQQYGYLIEYLVEHSFFINFFFEHLIAPKMLSSFFQSDISKNPLAYYMDEEKLNNHYNNVNKIIEYSDSINSKLIAVVFPDLTNGIEFSNLFSKYLIKFFQENNILVINVYDLLSGTTVKQRVINQFDSHPNEYVNLLISNNLFELINNTK